MQLSRIVGAAFALIVAGCAGASADALQLIADVPATPTTTTTAAPPETPAPTTSVPDIRSGQPRPDWLGTTDVPASQGPGIDQPAPPELIDRQFWTEDILPPPADDQFASTLMSPPPHEILWRSTWKSGCPVPFSELSYAQVSFFGFDGQFHTGEFLVHRDFGEGLVDVFEQLHALRFPIEEMRVVSRDDLTAAPTGDTNNTTSFVCRRTVGSTKWSRHAYGGAIDINPFHNPYVKGDRVIPALATAYLDRDRDVPGMISLEIEAMFADMGWEWGGNWETALDWMHFSDTGG